MPCHSMGLRVLLPHSLTPSKAMNIFTFTHIHNRWLDEPFTVSQERDYLKNKLQKNHLAFVFSTHYASTLHLRYTFISLSFSFLIIYSLLTIKARRYEITTRIQTPTSPSVLALFSVLFCVTEWTKSMCTD